MQLQNSQIKLRNLVKKSNLGAVYDARIEITEGEEEAENQGNNNKYANFDDTNIRSLHKNSIYSVRVIPGLSSKQLAAFLSCQSTVPVNTNILSILGYSISEHRNGLIDVYLVSEKKQFNFKAAMNILASPSSSSTLGNINSSPENNCSRSNRSSQLFLQSSQTCVNSFSQKLNLAS